MEELDSQEWLSKEQAANFLGTSLKTIQRYTADGKLVARYITQKGSPYAYYKLDDLKQFKQYGYVAKQANSEETNIASNPMDTMSRVDNKKLVQSKLSPDKLIDALVGRMLNEAQNRGLLNLASTPTSKTKEKPVLVPVADKIMLTIAEAAALSGRAERELRKAFLNGTLHGAKLGKGIKVRRKDLEAYIDSLFTK